MGVLTDDVLRHRSRTLRDLIEPIAANVYFAPEAHDAYASLRCDRAAGYFASRGACLGGGTGSPPSSVVAAAFGVFQPALVDTCIRAAWSSTDGPSILGARETGAVAGLTRLFGSDAAGIEHDGVHRATELLRRGADAASLEGRALFSGLRSLGTPGTLIGDLWRAADLVREHRGDSHIMAWASHGVDATQVTVLTELWWRLPVRSYVKTRGWNDAEIDTAVDALHTDGLVDDGGFTEAGRSLRASIEAATDRQERSIIAAIGDDFDELARLLTPLAEAIIAGKGYPTDPRTRTRYDE